MVHTRGTELLHTCAQLQQSEQSLFVSVFHQPVVIPLDVFTSREKLPKVIDVSGTEIATVSWATPSLSITDTAASVYPTMIPEKMFKQILDATNEAALTCRIEQSNLMTIK